MKINRSERPPSRYFKQMKVTSQDEQLRHSQTQDNGLYQLQICNMVTSENAFAATMAMEIQQLQEDIKQADLDQSIRQSKPSELRCPFYSQQGLRQGAQEVALLCARPYQGDRREEA